MASVPCIQLSHNHCPISSILYKPHLCKWQRLGQDVLVGPAIDVHLAQLGQGEEEDADDDVERVEGRQGHHEAMKLELVFQSREQHDGRDVADEAEDADGKQQHDLENELHGLLVVHLLLSLVGRRDVGDDRVVHDVGDVVEDDVDCGRHFK